MKKLAVCALLMVLLAVLTSPALAVQVNTSKKKDLGVDKDKMHWYIMNYGRDKGVPFAVVRKYYEDSPLKKGVIELLASKLGLSPEKAGKLDSTEYYYEYTADGKQFALVYLKHYDAQDNELHSTVYSGKNKIFSPMADVNNNHPVYKGAELAGVIRNVIRKSKVPVVRPSR